MEVEHDIESLSLQLLGKTTSYLNKEEHAVVNRIAKHMITSQNTLNLADAEASFGDRLADKVASIGGSWGFIISFGIVLTVWIVMNSKILIYRHLAFDPYPYIFLNLILSMLAAIQAPIIMMSQNRQAQKDRIAAAHDYQVNLHAELEIMRVHKKLDKLIKHMQLKDLK